MKLKPRSTCLADKLDHKRPYFEVSSLIVLGEVDTIKQYFFKKPPYIYRDNITNNNCAQI